MKHKYFDPAHWERWFWSLPIIERIVQWSKTHSLPGFFRVPIYDVIVFVYEESRRFDLFTRANSIAFSFFMSLFPTILMFFTVLPFMLGFLAGFWPELDNFNRILEDEIHRVMPGQAGDILFSYIYDIINEPRVGLLSFGFVLTVYFSSNGMLAMMQSFEKSYHNITFKQRSELKKRVIAIGLTGVLGAMVVASVVLVILGNQLLYWLSDYILVSGLSMGGVDLLRWVVIVIFYYFCIAFLYRYGAATYRRFSFFSPGTTLATLLCILSSWAFSFYIDEFNRYDSYAKFYGSITTIIIVMLWIQINALVLLIGFELNASIAVNSDRLRAILSMQQPKPADEREEV